MLCAAAAAVVPNNIRRNEIVDFLHSHKHTNQIETDKRETEYETSGDVNCERSVVAT